MGYLRNQLATVVTGAFAVVLTVLWPWFIGFAPVLNFVFVMAVTITWFLTFACWFSQVSVNYMKRWNIEQTTHEARNLTSVAVVAQSHGTNGHAASSLELNEAKTRLSDELDRLRDTVKIQDSEIARLNKEIANLETRVQIESLRTELANLKALASKK